MEHQGSQGRGGEYGVYDRVPGEGGAGKVEAPKEPGYHTGDTGIQVGNDGRPPVAHGPPGEYVPQEGYGH